MRDFNTNLKYLLAYGRFGTEINLGRLTWGSVVEAQVPMGTNQFIWLDNKMDLLILHTLKTLMVCLCKFRNQAMV